MKKRLIITTVVAFVLLAAAIAAGLNAIFTVTHVRAEFTTCSEAGEAEAVELREKLDAYIGKSSTFLNLNDVRKTVESYPCFRLECIEKQYPTTIRLMITERKETFACAREEGGYAIFDEEGRYLYDSETNVNRVAGENILLDGFSLDADNMLLVGDYVEQLLSVAATFRDTLTEIRANVISVTLKKQTSDARSDFFRIQMQEGVVIDLVNPSVRAEDKADVALQTYMKLSDEARTFGFITVVDRTETGELFSDYSRNSQFA